MAFTSGVAVALMSAACGLAGGIEDITVVDRELPDGSTNTPRDGAGPRPDGDVDALDSATDAGGDAVVKTQCDPVTPACLDDSSPAAQPACPGAGGECQMACDSFVVDDQKGLSADIRKPSTPPSA